MNIINYYYKIVLFIILKKKRDFTLKKRIFLFLGTILLITLGIKVSYLKPNIPSLTLTSIKNQTYPLKDAKEQVVLVQFWATSCPSCIQEMPQLVKLHQKFKHTSFKIVSIAMEYDVPLYVINYSQTNHIPFDIVIDKNGSFARAFGGIEAVPTLFLANKEGQIVKKLVGVPPIEELDQLITELL